MSQTKWIEIETVHRFITQKLEGVVPKDAWPFMISIAVMAVLQDGRPESLSLDLQTHHG